MLRIKANMNNSDSVIESGISIKMLIMFELMHQILLAVTLSQKMIDSLVILQLLKRRREKKHLKNDKKQLIAKECKNMNVI